MDSLTKLNLDNYKPLRDVVFENLRSAILEGKLKSGQRLMEVQLAEQLGVSRTPVREAIRKLELEGLVVMLPRKGAYVANISVKDLMDVLEIRASLEGLGASLAAERRTEEDIKNLEEIEEECEQAVITQDIDMLLKKDIEYSLLIMDAIIEGYDVLKKLGYEILPKGEYENCVNKKERCAFIYRFLFSNFLGKMCISDHAMSAKEEFILMENEFEKLKKKAGIETKVYDNLKLALLNYNK